MYGIYKFMTHELELSGTRLLVYAFIYHKCVMLDEDEVSIDDIAEACNIARNSSHTYIARLRAKGLINWTIAASGMHKFTINHDNQESSRNSFQSNA